MSNVLQIDKLNSQCKIRLAPSKIHGVGVFAIRDISKGELLYANHAPQVYDIPYSRLGNLFPEVKALILERWPGVTQGEKFAYPDTRFQAYMNHSDDPNYDNLTDRALKNIKTGEEVTENYKNILGWKEVFPWLLVKEKDNG